MFVFLAFFHVVASITNLSTFSGGKDTLFSYICTLKTEITKNAILWQEFLSSVPAAWEP